jgi:hypothetical protein
MALTPTHFRVETPDGHTEDYRIRDGKVEALQSQGDLTQDDRDWHHLNGQELTSHINRNSVVGRWLEHHLGWRRLIQVCVDEQNLYDLNSLVRKAHR